MKRASLLALALALVSGTAGATVVKALDVEALSRRAERIVRGTVLGSASHWVDGTLRTETRVLVERCYKGPCDAEELVVQVRGGEDDGLRVVVPGMPAFEDGEEVVLFLRDAGRTADAAPARSAARFVPVGLAQGKFRVVRRSGRELAVRDLDALRLAGPKALKVAELRAVDLEVLLRTVEAALDPPLP